MAGEGACMVVGGGGGGHVWQEGMCSGGGACMAGGMHVVGEGGVYGGGWCVLGKTAIAAGGTHPTGMHSCFQNILSGQN